MAILVNNGNARVRLSFLAMELESKKISLFSIENKNIDPLSSIPTYPLFSRKFATNDQFNMQGEFLGQTQGQELVESIEVPFTFSADFIFVNRDVKELDERVTKDAFISILEGGIFKSNNKVYRVLGNTGNINLEAKMYGKNLNNHWKNLFYNENAFVKNGTAYDEKGNSLLMQNPLLSSFNLSSLGMCLEIYIGAGTGQTRVLRYPLVAFNNPTTDMSGDIIKVNTNMVIKADVVEAQDFFIAGGKKEDNKFIKIDGVVAKTGLAGVPSEAQANEKWLAFDDETGKVMYIDNQVDLTPTTPLEVGTIFYLQKDDTGATAGTTTGLCASGTGVVIKSPSIFVVGKYDCEKPEAFLTRWNYDGEIATTSSNAKEVFGLEVHDFDELTGDFKRYNSENL